MPLGASDLQTIYYIGKPYFYKLGKKLALQFKKIY